jgi:hypothetical protein
MNVAKLNEYVIRDEVMKLLSAQEVDKIDNEAGAGRLREGQEYLDLEQALQGVKRAACTSPPHGRILPRDAVHAATWSKIVALVASATNEVP